jgi:hypothetical protein
MEMWRLGDKVRVKDLAKGIMFRLKENPNLISLSPYPPSPHA